MLTLATSSRCASPSPQPAGRTQPAALPLETPRALTPGTGGNKPCLFSLSRRLPGSAAATIAGALDVQCGPSPASAPDQHRAAAEAGVISRGDEDADSAAVQPGRRLTTAVREPRAGASGLRRRAQPDRRWPARLQRDRR